MQNRDARGAGAPGESGESSASGASGASGGERSEWIRLLGLDSVTRARLAQRTRNQRRLSYISVALVALMILGAGIIATPFVLQRYSASRLSAESSETAAAVEEWPSPQTSRALAAARAYNNRLFASGQPVLGEASDPFASASGASESSTDTADSASAKDSAYQSLLDADSVKGGVMGSIVIPKISVNLPIYHGTSESALASGAGHLYGTSLPVGGRNTHAVITGHRGLVAAEMFTRLDEMGVGDYFYVSVMGKTLGYKVDRISVIKPSETSSLKIEKGEDRVTLMTCTPYGVNTHRLLVSGVRAKIPQSIPDPNNATRDVRSLALWSVLVGVLPFLVPILWCRHPWMPMHHAAARHGL